MKRTLLLLFSLLTLGVSGVWAQITIGPSTGTYMDALDGTDDENGWAAYWKSTAKASDGTTQLLTLQAPNGMNTSNGDLYSNANGYSLTVPEGYLISSYSFNGTATGGDVTITPAGGSGTTITSGNSLGEALSITVRAKSTTFTISGSGHIESLNLVVTVSPIPVTIAYCPGYTTSGCSHSLPSTYGSFSGQIFTTSAASGIAGISVTASSGLTITEQSVDVKDYGKCFKLVTANCTTDYTVTLQAPTGYVITGYKIGGSANTYNAKHTLTSADGSVSAVVSSPPYNTTANTPEPFVVSGLNSQSTYFTINTAQHAVDGGTAGNTLYLPIFQIFVAKASEVVNDTYIVMFNGSKVATKTVSRILGSITTPSIPSVLERSLCTYEYFSDNTCETSLSTLPASGTTIYAKCSYPFTVSSNYATATWYNLKLNDVYPLYTSGATPNVSLPTTPGTETNMEWAFIGNPYEGLQIINKGAGDGYELSSADDNQGTTGSGSHATMTANGTQTYNRWFPKRSTHIEGGFYLYNSNGNALNYRSNANLAYWTGGADAGSTFTYYSVTTNTAELNEIVDRLDDKVYGSEYGEYSLSGDYTGFEAMMATVLSGMSTYSYTNLLNARAIDAAKSLNVPQNGDFLRIKASDTNKSAYSIASDIYLTSSNTQSDVNNSAYKDKRAGFVTGTANDNTTIFYFDGTHLIGLANGLQASSSSNFLKIGAAGVSTPIAFESIESTENKAFRIEFKADDGTTDRSLYTQRYSEVLFTDAAGGNATDPHYRYFLEKVTSLPVSISAASWATLYSPVALTIPDGVTAYIVTADNTTTLHLDEVDGIIPANTGVLLYGTQGNYNFTITTGGSADGNLLSGTIATISRPEYSYVLGNGENGVAFYGDGPSTAAGFKAYYVSASPVKSIAFDLETAVRAIEAAQNPNSEIFDLNGRRVLNPAKGIYIVNGKKVIIK